MAHMERGKPNLTKVSVNRTMFYETVSGKYVVSSGFVDENNQPYVMVCNDRGEVNCKQCVRGNDCSASLSGEKV